MGYFFRYRGIKYALANISLDDVQGEVELDTKGWDDIPELDVVVRDVIVLNLEHLKVMPWKKLHLIRQRCTQSEDKQTFP